MRRLTPFEQSQRSWARSIATYADIPDTYRPFFEPLRAAEAPFPGAVIAPSYEGFLHREAEKLVCTLAGEVHILEKRGGRFETHSIPIDRIHCVEFSVSLLDARIGIFAEGEAVPAAPTIRFNAVTDFLFTPLVTRIRLGTTESNWPTRSGRSELFNEWGRSNFKFMNYAKRSLLEGEAVLQHVLQPEVRVNLASGLGRTFTRTLAPTLATILTDRELIFIREVVRRGVKDRYGGVWHYIPLRKVVTLTVSEGHPHLLTLSVDLTGNARRDFHYGFAAAPELDELVERFHTLRRVAREALTVPGAVA